MILYTLCIDARPILVINTDPEIPVPDEVVHSPVMLDALRKINEICADTQLDERRLGQLEQIDDALDTWLGEDLATLKHDGIVLWDGDRSRVHVREARADEVIRWSNSYQEALATGEQDAGNEDYLVYLIEVS